jgi:hypothetical protein
MTDLGQGKGAFNATTLISLVALIISSVALFSTKDNSAKDNNDAKQLNTRLERIETTTGVLDKRIDKVTSDITDLQIKGWTFAQLNTSTKDYSVLQNDLGKFLISVQNVEKYANGYKLTLNIGNPNAITFNNVLATFSYGTPYDKSKDWKVWLDSLKTSQAYISKPLLAATWNRVVVVVAPAKEEDIGFITISLQTSQVQLVPDVRPQE